MKLFFSGGDSRLFWPQSGVVATLGFFDGVHAGHRFLIERVKAVALQCGLPSTVITFSDHPRKVLSPDFEPKLLNRYGEKITLLGKTGIEGCFVMDFTTQLSEMSAGTFIKEVLAGEFNVKALVIGYDHRFGKNRMDGFDEYKKSGKACGMEIIQVKPLPRSGQPVSSTVIRNFLLTGNIRLANRLLGYHYNLDGCVVHGNHLGRTIGFPTANVDWSDHYKVMPHDGIYAVWVRVDADWYKGMAYIGDRPSVALDGEKRFEVHLLDFSEELYGSKIRIEFVDYLREDKKFDSLHDLKRQLEQDKQLTERCLKMKEMKGMKK